MQQLEYYLKNFNVISFDIFDTAILRPYIKPTDVFSHIERIRGLKGFAKNRIKAEVKARKLSKDDEIRYDDIYNTLSSKYSSVYEYEKDFEERICQRNEEIYLIYQTALKANKKVIFVSDMYLPESIIVNILHKNGYVEYDHIFLSSSYKKTKQTGGLYDIVLNVLGEKPELILHIGDNRHGDIERAQSRNINTFFYAKVIDRFLDAHKNINDLLGNDTDSRFQKDQLTLSIIIGLNSIIWNENTNNSYWSKVGSLYAAPFMFLFTKWVYDNASKSGKRNVAFAARDGFNLIKIFKKFDSKSEFNVQYVYLPRRVSEYSNIKNDLDLDLFFKELGNNYKSLLDFINDFANEKNEIKLKWDIFKQKEPLIYSDLKNFILENKEIFIQSSSDRRELVYNYLNHLGLLNSDLIFVDSATIQARSQKLLQGLITEKQLSISVLGYYYIIYNWHDILQQMEMRPDGNYIYRTEEWHLMEFFMSSPENPIISIKNEGEEFIPIYESIESNQNEIFRVETYNQVSEGILLFTDRIFDIFNEIDTITDLDTVVLHLNNLITNPTKEDALHTRFVKHSEFNDINYTLLGINYSNGIASNLKKIYAQRVQVKRISPELEHFFSGKPQRYAISSRLDCFLSLNVSSMSKHPRSYDQANVSLIHKNGNIEIIDSVNHWNFRMGVCLRYRPMHPDDIIYNKFDKNTELFVSIIYNQKERHKKIFPFPIIDISPNGRKALTLSSNQYYRYLNQHMKEQNGYSFIDRVNDFEEDKGIILLDMDTNEYKLIISFLDVIDKIRTTTKVIVSDLYVKNMAFNPDGSRFFITIDSTLSESEPNFPFSFTCDTRGEDISQIIENKEVLSWSGNDKLLIFEKEFNQGFVNKSMTTVNVSEINELTGKITEFDNPFFKGNGRYSLSPDGRYVIKDSQSSFTLHYQKLEFYDICKTKSIVLGYFNADPDYYGSQPDLRCDLNPSWSECGNFILFNSIHEGYRGVYVIEKNEIISEIDREIETPDEEELSILIKHQINIIKRKQTPKSKKIITKFKNRIKRTYVYRFINSFKI